MSEARLNLPEEFLAEYEVVRELGQGGMGVVLLCEQKRLKRKVAVKLLLAECEDVYYKRRFRREADILVSLRHAHIVNILDFGIADKMPYLVQEYLVGHPFDAVLASKAPLPLPVSIQFACQIANALAYAHEKKVIHRDLKPGNIFVTKSNHLKLLDFGLALGLNNMTRLTETGTIVGTPNYMAPEQMCTTSVDERADLYALGAIIYYMVSGQLPFLGSTLDEMMSMKMIGSYTPLEAVTTGALPRDLITLVEDLIHADPDKRPESAAIVEDKLHSISSSLKQIELPTKAKKNPLRHRAQNQEKSIALTPIPPPPKNKRNLAIASITACLLLCTVFLYLSFNKEKANVATPHCDFTTCSVENGILTMVLTASSSTECRLLCEVQGFEPLIMARGNKWQESIGPLQPGKNYGVTVGLRSRGKIVATRRFDVVTKPWQPEKVHQTTKLYYPPALSADQLTLCNTAGKLTSLSLLTRKVLWQKSRDIGLCALRADGDTLYVAERDRYIVQARRLSDGKLLWKKELAKDCDDKFFLTATNVYVRIKGVGFHCLDKSSGKVIWQSDEYARPPWFVTNDFITHNVEDYTLPSRLVRKSSNGEIVAKRTKTSSLAATNYALYKRRLYFGTEDRNIVSAPWQGNETKLFTPGGKPSVVATGEGIVFVLTFSPNRLQARQLNTGEKLWQKNVEVKATESHTIAYENGLLCLMTSSKGLTCYEAKTGQVLFKANNEATGQFGISFHNSGVIFSLNKQTIALLKYPRDWPPTRRLRI